MHKMTATRIRFLVAVSYLSVSARISHFGQSGRSNQCESINKKLTLLTPPVARENITCLIHGDFWETESAMKTMATRVRSLVAFYWIAGVVRITKSRQIYILKTVREYIYAWYLFDIPWQADRLDKRLICVVIWGYKAGTMKDVYKLSVKNEQLVLSCLFTRNLSLWLWN